MKVYTILGSVSAVFGLLTTSVLAQPQESWSAEGFKAPESALLDEARGVLYVSNVNGNPTDKDGNGYISKLSPDGTVIAVNAFPTMRAVFGTYDVNARLASAEGDDQKGIDREQ